MSRNNMAPLIITAVISVALWGFGLTTGFIEKAVVFGYNMTGGLFSESQKSLVIDETETEIVYGKYTYKLLNSVVIHDQVTSIADKAFKGNRLTSITIGKDVEMGRDSFGYGFENIYNTNNKEPGTYTRENTKTSSWLIWHGDFCYDVVGYEIRILNYKGDETAVIPDNIFGRSVTNIAEGSFRNKMLTGVTIPNTVVLIGKNAFDENYLTRVVIPNSVTTVGDNAFCCNQLTNLTIGTRVEAIGNAAFSEGNLGTGKLTGVFIPNSVKSIGYNAFNGQPLTRVSIGANVVLGSTDDGQTGVLGRATGFNTAYSNNDRRASVFSRSNAQSTSWSRTAR